LYVALGVTRTTNLRQYRECPKEATEEHYEKYQRLNLVSVVMLNGRNGGKREREQYF